MTKTSEQLKNLCEDWINNLKIPNQDITDQVNKEKIIFDWFIQAGSKGSTLRISKIKDRDDRILIDTQINISDMHKNALAQLGNKESYGFIMTLNEFATIMGLGIQWKFEKGVPLGFILSGYIDVEELERPTFYKKCDNINMTKASLIQKFQTLNPKATASDVSETSEKSIYG